MLLIDIAQQYRLDIVIPVTFFIGGTIFILWDGYFGQ